MLSATNFPDALYLTDKGYFKGSRYLLLDDTSLMLLFDSCGKISGVQLGVSTSISMHLEKYILLVKHLCSVLLISSRLQQFDPSISEFVTAHRCSSGCPNKVMYDDISCDVTNSLRPIHTSDANIEANARAEKTSGRKYRRSKKENFLFMPSVSASTCFHHYCVCACVFSVSGLFSVLWVGYIFAPASTETGAAFSCYISRAT